MHCLQSKLLTVDDIGGSRASGTPPHAYADSRGEEECQSGGGGGGSGSGSAAEESSGSKDGAGFKLGHGPDGSNISQAIFIATMDQGTLQGLDESLQKKTRLVASRGTNMLGEIEKHMHKVNGVRWWCARVC